MRPPTTLDRAPQHLPVPLGGLAPAHRNEPRLSRTWRVQQTRIISAGGLMLGLLGGWLAVATPAISVYADGTSIHVGDVTLLPLHEQRSPGVRVYTGAVAFVLVDLNPHEVRAAAVTSLNGLSVNGVCHLTRAGRGGGREDCAFRVHGTTLRSTDLFDPSDHSWHRTYADGRTTTFNVPPGTSLVPVPIPLGR